MIIINIKEGEDINRALKRYKRKQRDLRLMKELRRRKYYTKPSVQRRHEVMNAKYRIEKFGS